MITIQPLLIPLVGIVLGILAGYWFELPLTLPGAILFLLFFIFLFLKSIRGIIWVLFLSIFSALNYTWQIKYVGKNDLRNVIGKEPAIVTVSGRIKGIPITRTIKNNGYKNSVITKFCLDVDSIQFRRSKTNLVADGKVAIIIRGGPVEVIGNGSKIRLFGVIKPPPSSKIYGLYNYREDLRKRGIFYMLIVESSADVELIEPAGSVSWTERFIKWADKTLQYGLPEKLLETDLRAAMLFGLKTRLSDEYQKNFMHSGTMHLFAVSGIHVGILSGAILVFLMSLNISRQICGLITLPILWFFVAATGWQASAIRAAIMVTVLTGSWIFNRPSDLLNSLFAAAVIILLLEPSQLFQTGFQLSFSVVLMLALTVPIFKKSLIELLKTDPFLPEQLLPCYKKLLFKSVHHLGSAFITSIAALLGSLPLIASYFNIVSPVSVLANLAVVPLGTLCLISTVASLICSPFCLYLTELFNWSGWLWSRLMIELTDWFSRGGWFYVKSPTTTQVVMYYVIIFLFLLILSNEWKKKLWILLLMISFIFLCVTFWLNYTGVKIDVVSLERGHVVYVQENFSKHTLMDCGTVDDVNSVIQPLLISRGANKLSNLFLTHGDLNHVSGAVELSKAIFIEHVYVSNFRQRSRYYSDTIEYFNKCGILWFVSYPQRIENWEVISPANTVQKHRADDLTLVLRGNFKSTRVLLLSDVSKEMLDYLIENGVDMEADILIGSDVSIAHILKSDSLNLINPELIIIAERNTNLKTEDLIDRIKVATRRNAKVYLLDSYSGLTLKVRGKSYYLEPTENTREFLPVMDEL